MRRLASTQLATPLARRRMRPVRVQSKWNARSSCRLHSSRSQRRLARVSPARAACWRWPASATALAQAHPPSGRRRLGADTNAADAPWPPLLGRPLPSQPWWPSLCGAPSRSQPCLQRDRQVDSGMGAQGRGGGRRARSTKQADAHTQRLGGALRNHGAGTEGRDAPDLFLPLVEKTESNRPMVPSTRAILSGAGLGLLPEAKGDWLGV